MKKWKESTSNVAKSYVNKPCRKLDAIEKQGDFPLFCNSSFSDYFTVVLVCFSICFLLSCF